jgi:hypothetical protein
MPLKYVHLKLIFLFGLFILAPFSDAFRSYYEASNGWAINDKTGVA